MRCDAPEDMPGRLESQSADSVAAEASRGVHGLSSLILGAPSDMQFLLQSRHQGRVAPLLLLQLGFEPLHLFVGFFYVGSLSAASGLRTPKYAHHNIPRTNQNLLHKSTSNTCTSAGDANGVSIPRRKPAGI